MSVVPVIRPFGLVDVAWIPLYWRRLPACSIESCDLGDVQSVRRHLLVTNPGQTNRGGHGDVTG